MVVTRSLAAALLAAAVANGAVAQGLSVAPSDSVHAVVSAQKGKRITVRLRSGQELSGVVRDVTERLIVLGEVSGREFFDAAVALDAVEAVLVRTRAQ